MTASSTNVPTREVGVTRRGFTLIELLIVLFVVMMLLALLLPAIQTARESARNSHCRSNLMQIGVALQNYEHAHLVLPPGSVNATGPIRNEDRDYHVSWIVQLLPFLDQYNVYRRFDFTRGVYDAKHNDVREQIIHVLCCPSTGSAAGETSYAGCHHDVTAPIDIDNHGVLYLNSRIKTNDVTDGTGYTIYAGEKAPADFALGWASGTSATLRNTGVRLNAGASLAGTMAPDDANNQMPPEYVGGFSGAHNGVVNLLMGDGAVRGMAVTIDLTNLQRLGHRSDGGMVDAF